MKTIEEEAKEINPYKVSESIGNCLAFNKGFRAGVEFAQRWISVDEEKPEQGEIVLIKFNIAETKTQLAETGVVNIGYYLETKIFDIEQQCGIVVTHWRPIELK